MASSAPSGSKSSAAASSSAAAGSSATTAEALEYEKLTEAGAFHEIEPEAFEYAPEAETKNTQAWGFNNGIENGV